MALTPMMQCYIETKEKYKDCILFYRLGDFYEMFFEDAIKVSHDLELTLTGKNAGLEERIPMCGIPHHAANLYIEKFEGKLRFIALGKGHGMGMSQYGANYCAKEGMSYDEILKKYYSGIELKNIHEK